LHSRAHAVISESYPELYGKADSKTQSAIKGAGLDRLRYTAWLYKVAQSQIAGTVERVKLVPLWDFVDMLGYLSKVSKFEEIMIKQ